MGFDPPNQTVAEGAPLDPDPEAGASVEAVVALGLAVGAARRASTDLHATSPAHENDSAAASANRCEG